MPSRQRASRGGLLAALALTLLLSLGIVAIVGSDDTPDRRIVPPGNSPRHPVAEEIRSLQDDQADRLRDLNTRAQASENPEEELALQREIQQVKIATEIAMFQAQLRQAESRGDAATAEKLRTVLEAYENLGRRRAAPETRPPGNAAAREGVAP